MGSPLVCPHCSTLNGVLAFECRHCGEGDIVLAGNLERPVPWASDEHFRAAPSAAWETDKIPDLWRATDAAARDVVVIDAHDFLGYCLLLRAMHERFDLEDSARWFDDSIFFLRGGYEFFAHLNATSRMTLRGRIFGGLSHGQRPEERFRAWFRRLADVAIQRGQGELDVFLSEEINSGSGVNRMMNVIAEEAEILGKALQQYLVVRFRFFVASNTTASVFKPEQYAADLTRRGLRAYQCGRLRIENSFRWFHGPLLGYDEPDINGLRVSSKGKHAREQYQSIKYTANAFVMTCPKNGRDVHLSGPGRNDIPNYIGVTILELVGPLRDSPLYELMRGTIAREGCTECRRLFDNLRAPTVPWPSNEL